MRTQRTTAFIIFGIFLAAGEVGCKSHSPSHVVASAVTGRVVDASTHQPIKDVEVRRHGVDDDHRSTQPLKGGQLMEQKPAVRTGPDGRFKLPSVRALTLFHGSGFYSANLTFTHPRYRPLSAVFTQRDTTNSVDGEPLIDTGEVVMTHK